MRNITNFPEAHEALRDFYGASTSGPYDLGRIKHLLELLDNPQDSLKVVHIAGTSGKTSTAYYTAALLAQSGAKVGLTVSPHVDEINERVQIGLKPMPEVDFCQALGLFIEKVHAFDVHPSYFELMVAFAYYEFARQGVDYAVIETGLGGLLDGTNVVSRPDKVCVLTDIGYDHTEVLGNTLPEIAYQKAGIIQRQNHVFMYEQATEIMNVFIEVCTSNQATLHEQDPRLHYSISAKLPLFQQRNFGLALKAVAFVLERDGLPRLTFRQMQNATEIYIPARMETIKCGDKIVIVDGSHNGQKIEALMRSIVERYPGKKSAAVAAFVQGEDIRWQQGVSALLPHIENLTLTSFTAEQDVPKVSTDPNRIAAYCKEQGFEHISVELESQKAWKKLLESPEDILLVVGSFYLLNHIRPLLREATA